MIKNIIRKSTAGLLYGLDMLFPSRGISVLLYHRVCDVGENPPITSVTVDEFENQVKYLKKHGYRTVTIDEMLDMIAGKKPIGKKTVMITFDDGFADNFRAFEILNRYGFSSVIFVSTAFIGKKFNYMPYYFDKDSMDYESSRIKDAPYEYLTADQLEKAAELGVEVCPHTHHHIDMVSHDHKTVEKEVLTSKKIIEEITRREVKCTSYPFGLYNSETVSILKSFGFKCAFAVITGRIMPGDDPFTLKRYNTPPMSDKIIFKLALGKRIKTYDRISSASHRK